MTEVCNLLKELKIDEVYTAKQLKDFISFNNVVVLCEDTARFVEDSNMKFKVKNIFEAYTHQHEFPNIYRIPGQKKPVYIVQKI